MKDKKQEMPQAPALPIATGAYLLRSPSTGLVLQYNAKSNRFELAERNEILFREEQTLWVEPLPEYQFSGVEDVLYTLSQIGAGTSTTEVMEIPNADRKRKAHIGRHKAHGHPTALWKLLRVGDRKDGEFYYIVNLHSGLALEGGHSPAKDAKEATYLYQVEHQIDTPAQIWEFAIPMTPVPVGWLQIKNVSTGHMLSHSYAYSPPRLIDVLPPPARTSNYRETWDTQWALISAIALGFDKSHKGKYVIKNRLTGGILRTLPSTNGANPEDRDGVPAMMKGFPLAIELDAQGNWRIWDRERGTMLGEALASTSIGGNLPVANSNELDPTRSWRFIPMQDVDAMVVPEVSLPPNYTAKAVLP